MSTLSQVGSSNIRANGNASDRSKLDRIKGITLELLQGPYFPKIKKAPDILYVAMSIWGLESGFNLWHTKNIGSKEFALLSGYDSSHKSPVTTKESTNARKYWNSPVINNLRIVKHHDVEVQKALYQGVIAHGLSATMGWYHIRNNRLNEDTARFKSLKSDILIEVDPGEKVTDLFPNNETGERRSIASGLMILDLHYGWNEHAAFTDEGRLKLAVGAYVGKKGAKDSNGYSPEDREADVFGGRGHVPTMLASIGLTRSGYTIPSSAQQIIDNSKRVANVPTTTENKQTQIATTSGNRMKMPGCA